MSNPFAAINAGLRQCAGVPFERHGIFMANVKTRSNIKVVGFWLQHRIYIVGVEKNGTIYAINGVAREISKTAGWQHLTPRDATRPMPGISVMIDVGLAMATDRDPHQEGLCRHQF